MHVALLLAYWRDDAHEEVLDVYRHAVIREANDNPQDEENGGLLHDLANDPLLRQLSVHVAKL